MLFRSYSLIRKLIEVGGATPQTQLDGRNLYEQLLIPTRIYVKSLLALMQAMPVHGLAHITGGGLTDNIPRVLREGLEARLQRQRWPSMAVFDWLARTGKMAAAQMYRTFNCGIGMIAIVASERADEAIRFLTQHGEQAMRIGEVQHGTRGVVIE